MQPLTPEQRLEVERNIGLAHYFAARYRVAESEKDDFVQECCIGLMESIQSSAQARFTLGTIVGMNSKGAYFRLKRSRRPMTWIPKGEQLPCVLSTETPVGDDGLVLGDTFAACGPSPEVAATAHELARMLPDREADALCMLADGCTLTEVGEAHGVTGSGARLRILKALGKVRRRCR